MAGLSRRLTSIVNVMMVALILTLAAVLGSGSPTTAADPPDAVIDLPAGLACDDFDLRIEIGFPVVMEK
jgi:hypothetical protein